MNLLRRDGLERVQDVLMTLGLGIMVLVNVANVLARKVFNTSLVWTMEVSVTLFVWLAFLGSIKLAKYGQHLQVNFLLRKLEPGGRRWAGILVDTLVLLFCAITVATSGPVLRSAALMRLSTVPWNAQALFWAAPVGFGGIAVFMVIRIVARLRGETLDADALPEGGDN